MVWSEYHCSSTSVKTKPYSHFFSFVIAARFRRIASNEFDKQVNVHVAMDNTIVLDDLRTFSLADFHCFLFFYQGKLCQINSKVRTTTKKSTDTQTGWKPLVIIIPLRLGLSDVNLGYIEQIKVTFQTRFHAHGYFSL